MADLATPGLLDRAIRRITDARRDMAASVAPAADESIPAQMRACLAADASGRLAFLRDLASFDSDQAAIAQAATRLAEVAEDPASPAAGLAALLARRAWVRDPATAKLLEPVLLRLAAHYLLHEGRGKRAADPVAHFHLSNGARIERLCPLADTSEKGMKESAALMVNYLYDPAGIEQHHEDYAGEGRRNAAQAIRRLLKP